MVNLARMRSTAMWKKVVDFKESDEKTKKDFDEFTAKCGLDPFKQIDSVFVALPRMGGETKEFAAILRGSFNEQKLVHGAKDQAKKEGNDVVVTEYGGKKVYSESKQEQTQAVFLDNKTVAVGGKEWIKKVIDLSAGKEVGGSAKQNEPLGALMKRTKTSDAI